MWTHDDHGFSSLPTDRHDPTALQWRLQDILPANYNNQQPPVVKDEAVEVRVNMAILSFHRISEVDQSLKLDIFLHLMWTDKRLNMPRGLDGRKKLVLGSQVVSHLWVPALNFRNARSTQIFNSISPAVYATLSNRSEVFLAVRLSLDVNCDMNFASYPFDTQRCKIEIGSRESCPSSCLHSSLSVSHSSLFIDFSNITWFSHLPLSFISQRRLEAVMEELHADQEPEPASI